MHRDDNHLMIDIETLSSDKTAVVTSIGAVVFNLEDGITDEFHIRINPRTAQKAGGTINADTVLWWMRQSPEAQEELKGKEDFVHAMREFRSFVLGKRIKHVWGNAPSFDCDILRYNFGLADALSKERVVCPWRYWQERCFRTLKNIYHVELEREGTHHNALDDAKYQTAYALAVLREIVPHDEEEE